jgi:hypothetical protein
MREAINSVLAKQGPVIAAKPVDGMVSLADVHKAIIHVLEDLHLIPKEILERYAKFPNSDIGIMARELLSLRERIGRVVHKMEYPEAVEYAPATDFDGKHFICGSCGSLVIDRAIHTAFHEREKPCSLIHKSKPWLEEL